MRSDQMPSKCNGECAFEDPDLVELVADLAERPLTKEDASLLFDPDLDDLIKQARKVARNHGISSETMLPVKAKE